jgi:hypothetical protein
MSKPWLGNFSGMEFALVRGELTYRGESMMLANKGPLCTFLCFPATVLSSEVRLAIVPKVEENLELGTFIGPQMIDMKSDSLRRN